MHLQRHLRFGNEAKLEELWFRFAETSRKQVVVQFARLVARAARAASERSALPTQEDTREEPRR